MEDEGILALFWERDEGAIRAAKEKYEGYCAAIAGNILESREDREECVSDTFLRAWNAIPPARPERLSAFLGKITRGLCLNRLERERAQKRGGGAAALALEELGELVSGAEGPEAALERRELLGSINAFLKALPREQRILFVRRYWYFDSIPQLAVRFGKTENSVSVTLHRLRQRLGAHLREGGFTL